MTKYDVTNRAKIEGNTLHVNHSQEADSAILGAKAIKEKTGGKSELGYHVGKFPVTIFMQWALEDCGDKLAYLQGRHNHDPELARKFAARLNSAEFQAFRIWNGNVGASDILKEGNKATKKETK